MIASVYIGFAVADGRWRVIAIEIVVALDTGWFVDDVSIGGSPVGLTSTDWIETTGIQQNHWVLQLFATCDLSPDVQSSGEQIVEGYYIYRLEGNELSLSGLSTQCLKATKGSMVAVISNLPTGDLQYLDADYEFRVTIPRTGGSTAKTAQRSKGPGQPPSL